MAATKLSPQKLSEAHVTKQICDYMRWRGWRPIRLNRAMMMGFSGLVTFGEPELGLFIFVHSCDWRKFSFDITRCVSWHGPE